jgi:hypothetical protein
MADFIHDDPFVFLPRYLGGHDVPFIGDYSDLSRRFSNHGLPEISRLFSLLTDENDDYHGIVDALIRRMATGNSVRGLIEPTLYLMSAQYANLGATAFQSSGKTFDVLKSELQATRTYPVQNRDVLRYARKCNLSSAHDFADSLDRLTGIRLGFVVAAGEIPVSEIITPRYHLPSPSEVLRMFLYQELPLWRSGDVKPEYFQVSATEIGKFHQWVRGGMREVRIRPRQVWIPSSFLIDSLNGMRIPMPYRAFPNLIKGSVDDESVDPSIEGYIAKVISFQRTK